MTVCISHVLEVAVSLIVPTVDHLEPCIQSLLLFWQHVFVVCFVVIYYIYIYMCVWRSRKMSRKSLGVFARKRAVKVFWGQSVHFYISLRCFC